jgi:hypothetical protein
MMHHSTWLRRMRVTGRRRWSALLGLLLACALFATLPAPALATAPEMRGEWELVLEYGGGALRGTTLITQEANSKGEFAGPTHGIHFEDGGTGTFSGTLEGAKATVLMIADPVGAYPVGEFKSSAMTVNAGVSTLSLSGEGTITVSGKDTPGALFTATRLRSQKQIEEQEAQEKKEQEELQARERVRGEWAITLEAGPQVANAKALITQLPNAKNEFASSSVLFEGVVPGTFTGTLEGTEASVTLTSEAAGPYPASTFTGTKIAVAFTSSTMSMTGTGTLSTEGSSFPATFTATRIRTYQEVRHEIEEREAKEKAEREATEKAEREANEAKEKAEREASEKAAREVKEAHEREALEAKAKAEREAQERAAREAAERQEREAREAAQRAAAAKAALLVPVRLAGKAFAVGASEVLSLQIKNPNSYAISGRVTLLPASGRAGRASTAARAASGKAGSLGTASFGISPNGEQLVKLKLSRTGRAELARHRNLRVLATILTEASGQPTATKALVLTLHAAKAGRATH